MIATVFRQLTSCGIGVRSASLSIPLPDLAEAAGAMVAAAGSRDDTPPASPSGTPATRSKRNPHPHNADCADTPRSSPKPRRGPAHIVRRLFQPNGSRDLPADARELLRRDAGSGRTHPRLRRPGDQRRDGVASIRAAVLGRRIDPHRKFRKTMPASSVNGTRITFG
jgi:hypothetical protein